MAFMLTYFAYYKVSFMLINDTQTQTATEKSVKAIKTMAD